MPETWRRRAAHANHKRHHPNAKKYLSSKAAYSAAA